MHIVIVTANLPEEGKLESVFALDQAKALKSAGHDVTVASVDVRSLRRRRGYRSGYVSVEGIDAYVGSAYLGAVPGAIKVFFGKRILGRLLREICSAKSIPDIIHCHFAYYAQIAIDSAKMMNIPIVLTEHASWVTLSMPEKEREKLRNLYRGVDELVAVSASLAKTMSLISGREPKVVPNVVDSSVFANAREAACSKTGGLPGRASGKFVRFVSAGNLVDAKGFDVLIESFGLALKSNPNIRLQIMGDGPARPALTSLIHESDLGGRITLTGRYSRDEFARACSRSDCFVLASRKETFGVVYAEAMFAGLPVIATMCGGPEDIVSEKCGVLVPVDDAVQLASALLEMASHLDSYNADEIATSAMVKYSPVAVAEQLGGVYRSMMLRSSRGKGWR